MPETTAPENPQSQPIASIEPNQTSPPVAPKRNLLKLFLVCTLVIGLVVVVIFYFSTRTNQTTLTLTSSPSLLQSSPLSPLTTNSDTTNWKTYTNTKFRYSFTYPPTAALYENAPSNYITGTPSSTFLELRIPYKTSTYNIDILPDLAYTPRYPETKIPKFSSLRDYIEYLYHIEGDRIPEQNIPYDTSFDFTHKVLVFDDLTIDNKPAVYLRTEPLPNQGVALEGGFNVAYIEYQPGKILVLSGNPPYAEEDTNYLHQILSTFRFLD